MLEWQGVELLGLEHFAWFGNWTEVQVQLDYVGRWLAVLGSFYPEQLGERSVFVILEQAVLHFLSLGGALPLPWSWRRNLICCCTFLSSPCLRSS